MAEFFVRRPIVAIVIAIITVLAGLVAMRGLPEAQFPDIVPPQIIVSTVYPGAERADRGAVRRHTPSNSRIRTAWTTCCTCSRPMATTTRWR